MPLLKIKTYPDPVLKKKTVAIKEINGKTQTLIDDMVETMYNAPGIGLAASQVGVSRKLIVVDVSSLENKHPLIVIINPEIVYTEGEILSEEGCLSVPQFVSKIKRTNRVIVKGLDREGNPLEIEGTGLLSRALQHEIDHLNGTLIVDRLNPLEKEVFGKTYLKEIRRPIKSRV